MSVRVQVAVRSILRGLPTSTLEKRLKLLRSLSNLQPEFAEEQHQELAEYLEKLPNWAILKRGEHHLWRDMLIISRNSVDNRERFQCLLDSLARSLLPEIVCAAEDGSNYALAVITVRFSELTIEPEGVLVEINKFLGRENSGTFVIATIDFLASLGSKKRSAKARPACIALARELIATIPYSSPPADKVLNQMIAEFDQLGS